MGKIEVYSPIEGTFLDSVSSDSADDLQSKISLAVSAQREWNDIGVKKRASYMYQYRNLLIKHFDEIVDLVHKENGKTPGEAKAELEKAIEVTEFACSLPQVMVNESLEVSSGVTCTQVYKPLGVVACISPFNFPIMIPHWTVPIALVAGNSVILKPSDIVPLSARLMQRLFEDAGFPEGLFNVVNGGAEVVEGICDHPHIAAVSFVGSTAVAQTVYRRATQNLKRALCLGGAKNHLIVLPDAQADMTAQNVVASMSGMAGQRCMAASVMVAVGDCDHIIAKIVDEAKKVVCGDNVGAIISKPAVRRIENYIGEAERLGVKLLLDGRGQSVAGKENGYYVGPTILDQVTAEMSVAREEIFGPVLSIIRADTVDQAIDIQNSNPYGNGASVYTDHGGSAKYVRERLTAGMIGTNIGVPVPREPFSFGGLKMSKFGCGDITGKSSVQFWTQLVKYTTKWNKEAGTNWMS